MTTLASSPPLTVEAPDVARRMRFDIVHREVTTVATNRCVKKQNKTTARSRNGRGVLWLDERPRMAAYRRFVTPRGDVTRVTVNVTSVSSFERGCDAVFGVFAAPRSAEGKAW